MFDYSNWDKPNLDSKLSWTFKQVQEWFDREYPGYIITSSLQGMMVFDPEGKLYCCTTAIDGDIRYRRNAKA